MATVVGTLRAILEAQIGRFADDMNRAATAVERLADRSERVGRSMQRAGAIMSVAITAPLLLFGRQSVQAATDAEELQSAFNYSFGAMAQEMNAWAVATGDALGRSTQALQQQAFTFNQLFKAAAPTGDQAAQLSRDFTLLANDLSSFFNVAEDDALQKLRAGLVGEAEPLRAFGVFLTAAAVEAKALQMGLAANAEALTEQDKILARAAIIMEQTADAQGDLGRTAGSSANQQRAFNAAMEEFQVKVGQVILPILTDWLQTLGDVLDYLSQLSPETLGWIVAIGALAAALGPLLLVVGGLLHGFALVVSAGPAVAGAFRLIGAGIGALMGPIGLIVTAMAAAAAAIILYWDEIAGAVESVINWIIDNFNAAIGWIESLASAIGERLVRAFPFLVPVIESVGRWFTWLGETAQWLIGIFDSVITAIDDMITQAAEDYGWFFDILGSMGDANIPGLDLFGGGTGIPQSVIDELNAQVAAREQSERDAEDRRGPMTPAPTAPARGYDLPVPPVTLGDSTGTGGGGGGGSRVAREREIVDVIQQQTAALAEQAATLRVQAAAAGLSAGAAARMTAEHELLNSIMAENADRIAAAGEGTAELIDLRVMESEAVQNALNDYAAAAQALEDFQAAQQEAADTSRKWQSTFESMGDAVGKFGQDVLFTTDSIMEALHNLALGLAQMVAQATIFEPIKGFISQALGGLLGGGGTSKRFKMRAGGGGVRAGEGYIVGEDGPEPFFPGVNGTVLPNSALRDAGGSEAGLEMHLHVSAGVAQTVRAEMMALLPSIVTMVHEKISDTGQRGKGFAGSYSR